MATTTKIANTGAHNTDAPPPPPPPPTHTTTSTVPATPSATTTTTTATLPTPTTEEDNFDVTPTPVITLTLIENHTISRHISPPAQTPHTKSSHIAHQRHEIGTFHVFLGLLSV
ncbi:hypothetical protein SprV_0301182500 [Sparganum proliferum]